MKDTCLIVPSIRGESFDRFVREWMPTGLFERVDLVLVEDNPTRTFAANRLAVREHFCWADIDEHGWSWIIPRRSDTVRSFGYWWAWSRGYDYLMTLDDDCYPAEGYEGLDTLHKSMLTRTKWFNTLNSVRPRGVPFKNLGSRPVHVNHGIWQGVLDYDAPQQLVDPVPETYTHDNRIVPHGAFHPFCGMNVMWRREAIPLSYHLLMGQRVVTRGAVKLEGSPLIWSEPGLQKLPFDRFGDIFCGIIQKKICDHLGWAVSTGTPYIHHDRASDPFKNLRKEANGIEQNETLWEVIDSTRFRAGDGVLDCYRSVSESIRCIGGEHAAYWDTLADAMQTWTDLFET